MAALNNRYRCAELVTVPLDRETKLVYAKETRVWRVLPRQRAEILARCQTFDTLEKHARARCREFNLGEAAAGTIRERLTELAAAGFLLELHALQRHCQPADRSDADEAKITTVGFVTRDRLPLLQRGLKSFLGNAQRHARQPGLIVVDDTEDRPARQQCRDSLRNLAAEHGVTIGYADRDDRQTFATALAAEAGVDPAVVEFGLFGASIDHRGMASRNALLLEAAGEMLLQMDDDVLAEVGAPPEAQSGLRFFSEPDPAEYWFFKDREAALRAIHPVDCDLLGLHEQLLGKRLGDCLAAVGPDEELNLDQLTANWARRSASGAGRVRLTMNGLAGDCAMTWPRWYSLTGPSRERLVQSAAGYQTMIASREVLRCTRIPAIGAGTFCMTYAIGQDNRELLPPFFPVGRGADGLFGDMMQRCSEDGLIGHLPWAVVHAPGERRAFPEQVVRVDATARDLTMVVNLCVNQCPLGLGEQSAEERLAALGDYLIGLAALPLADFEESLRLMLWNQAYQELQGIESRLQTWANSPSYWAKDLQQYARTLTEAMQQREYVVPRELQAGRTKAAGLELTQQWLGRYGELLQSWPALVTAARRLRGKGQRLAPRM